MNKTEEYILKSNIVHNNTYDYSLVDFKNIKTKVKIICPEHGVFEQIPYHHYNGCGCPSCSKNKKFDNDSIIIRLNLKHNNKYDYSLLSYVNMNTKVKIICPEHGVFEQTPYEHLLRGCSKCRDIINSTPKLIKKSKEINSDKYDYSLTDFVNSRTKVKIICNYHKYIFEQTPNNHISKKHGCPLCGNINRRLSRISEISTNKFNGNQVVPSFNSLACEIFDKISIENNIHIQHAMNGGEYYIEKLGFWLDGYDKENNTAYEYDEKHHFDKYGNLLYFDIKRQIEIENFLKCKFIRIKYDEDILLSLNINIKKNKNEPFKVNI